MKVKFRPVLIPIIAALSFLIMILAIYLIAYQTLPDRKFVIQVILINGAIGAVPMLFKKYFFGSVYLAGGIVGFIADCIISIGQSNQGRPSMAGGFIFMLCVCISFILGIIAEIAVTLKRKKQESTG